MELRLQVLNSACFCKKHRFDFRLSCNNSKFGEIRFSYLKKCVAPDPQTV